MKIRFTRLAIADLRAVRAFIARDDIEAAATVVRRVEEAIQGLRQFPERGRPGRVAGTRELVVTRTPFIVPYRIMGECLDILAIMHGRRKWPSSF